MPQSDSEPAPFADATAVRRSEGGGIAADLDPGWDVGGSVLNGGYLLAVMARAAVLDSPHPHPVAVSASYLRPTGPGPVTLAVTPVEQCLSGQGGADLGGRPMPEVGLRRRVETRLDPSTAGWAIGRPSGEPVMRGWVRLTDGSAPDPFSLLLFADVLPPTSWSIGLLGWAPTVQLQVLVRALPAPGWCAVEARASEVAGGWIDEDYRIWDSTGRLVAQSRQLARVPRG